MNDALAVIGAGGHARSLIALLESRSFRILGIFDDSYAPGSEELICGYPLMGSLAQAPAAAPLVLAVGDNDRRAELFARFKARLHRESLLHRQAFVSPGVRLGAANQLFGNVFVNSQAVLGDNNIINTGAIIEHETHIGSHNHISVGTILCGRVTVGDYCMIGAGTTIIDKVSVCSRVVIGAGSSVIKDIIEPGTYVGSPARRVR
jgi:sugar O-acyltransferase (sialic acid O-acetyltransferase NeuD family)